MDPQQSTPPVSPMPPQAPQHNVVMGILSYLGILVFIPLLVEKNDPFVKFHVKQGLVLLILDVVAWFLAGFLWMLWILWPLFNLAILVLVVLGIVNVVKGKQQELPLIGSFAKYLTF